MNWIIAAIIAPIPLFHLWLHALLKSWRRFPYGIYIFGCFLWILSFSLFAKLDGEFFFMPQKEIKWLSYGLIILGALGVFSSILTLGIKRFFVWAVLKPDSVSAIRIKKGIFSWVAHPAYFSYLCISLGNFLSSGKWHLLFLFFYLLIFTPIFIRLEEEELRIRTGN